MELFLDGRVSLGELDLVEGSAQRFLRAGWRGLVTLLAQVRLSVGGFRFFVEFDVADVAWQPCEFRRDRERKLTEGDLRVWVVRHASEDGVDGGLGQRVVILVLKLGHESS